MPVTGGQRKQIPVGSQQLESHTRRGIVYHSIVAAVAASMAVLMFLHTFSPNLLFLKTAASRVYDYFTYFRFESQWSESCGSEQSGLESQFFYYCVCLWTSCLKLLNLSFLMHKIRGAS